MTAKVLSRQSLICIIVPVVWSWWIFNKVFFRVSMILWSFLRVDLMSNWWWFTKIATVKPWGIYVTEADDVTIGLMTSRVDKNAMRTCSAAFCPEVWSSKDRRLSTRYTREMDENSHKKTLIQIHLMWIPLIQVLLVWTPLIWKSTHGSLPYANQLMRSLLMQKLHLNSCEVFSWEIVSPQH